MCGDFQPRVDRTLFLFPLLPPSSFCPPLSSFSVRQKGRGKGKMHKSTYEGEEWLKNVGNEVTSRGGREGRSESPMGPMPFRRIPMLEPSPSSSNQAFKILDCEKLLGSMSTKYAYLYLVVTDSPDLVARHVPRWARRGRRCCWRSRRSLWRKPRPVGFAYFGL